MKDTQTSQQVSESEERILKSYLVCENFHMSLPGFVEQHRQQLPGANST